MRANLQAQHRQMAAEVADMARASKWQNDGTVLKYRTEKRYVISTGFLNASGTVDNMLHLDIAPYETGIADSMLFWDINVHKVEQLTTYFSGMLLLVKLEQMTACSAGILLRRCKAVPGCVLAWNREISELGAPGRHHTTRNQEHPDAITPQGTRSTRTPSHHKEPGAPGRHHTTRSTRTPSHHKDPGAPRRHTTTRTQEHSDAITPQVPRSTQTPLQHKPHAGTQEHWTPLD
ncbi:hypothetical protein STEG23_028162 [Scotinomys teguina]